MTYIHLDQWSPVKKGRPPQNIPKPAISILKRIREVATMDHSCFSFEEDRIVETALFGDSNGTEQDPTEYIKKKTSAWRKKHILEPLDRAIKLLENPDE